MDRQSEPSQVVIPLTGRLALRLQKASSIIGLMVAMVGAGHLVAWLIGNVV